MTSWLSFQVNSENHVINWDEAKIIGRESERMARCIREAISFRKASQDVMNRDVGAYQLSHVYDNLLLSVATPDGERMSVRQRQQPLPKRH